VGAVASRRPDVALVDELAHTNAAGSRHEKRYQDIEEILAAGIDVYTTMNIQHVESINDIVAKITGVRMQETIPDTFLIRADEVQVIDIPWEELVQRLKEGKVYIPERARQAMENFFQRGNLSALREMLLNFVARKMDAELLNYMKAKAISGTWPISERLVVCIAASPYAKQLVRKAYSIAQQMHAEWYAVYVSTPALKEPSDRDRAFLADSLNLAEQLGAKLIHLTGTDIANEILRFARENNITQVVIGKPLRSMLWGHIKGSPVSRLLHAQSEFEIHLVTPIPETAVPDISVKKEPLTFQIEHYLISFAMVIAITILNFGLYNFVLPSSLVYIYMLATIASAMLFGTGPSIFASVAGLLAYDFFFTQPRFSFSMEASNDIVNVSMFLMVAIVVSHLVKTVRRQNLTLQYRLKRTTLMEAMSKEFLQLSPVNELLTGFYQCSPESRHLSIFLRTTVLSEISRLTIKYVATLIDVPVLVLFKEKDKLQVWARSQAEIEISPNEMAVATWAFTHGEPAGPGTGTLSSTRFFFIPMKARNEIIGVVGIEYDYRQLLPEQRRFLGAILNLTSMAAFSWLSMEIA
jgi:two-component system sensor histidine kinase KdpD